MHRLFLILSFCFCSTLSSIEERKRSTQQAESYVEAKEYKEGLNIYQELLQTSSEPWERGVLMYNIGTTFLHAREYTEAIATFKAISYDYPLGTLVRYNTFRNLIIARLSAAIETSSITGLIEIEKTEKDLKELQEAFCQLEKARGQKECKESPPKALLKEWLAQEAIALQETINNHYFNETSWNTILQALQTTAKEMVEGALFLKSLPKDAQEKEKLYQGLFKLRIERVSLLWPRGKEELAKKNGAQETKKAQLFTEAEKAFKEGALQLEAGDFGEAEASFKTALEKLEILNEQSPPVVYEALNSSSKESEERQKEIRHLEEVLLQMDEEDKAMPRIEKIQQKSSSERKW